MSCPGGQLSGDELMSRSIQNSFLNDYMMVLIEAKTISCDETLNRVQKSGNPFRNVLWTNLSNGKICTKWLNPIFESINCYKTILF